MKFACAPIVLDYSVISIRPHLTPVHCQAGVCIVCLLNMILCSFNHWLVLYKVSLSCVHWQYYSVHVSSDVFFYICLCFSLVAESSEVN